MPIDDKLQDVILKLNAKVSCVLRFRIQIDVHKFYILMSHSTSANTDRRLKFDTTVLLVPMEICQNEFPSDDALASQPALRTPSENGYPRARACVCVCMYALTTTARNQIALSGNANQSADPADRGCCDAFFQRSVTVCVPWHADNADNTLTGCRGVSGEIMQNVWQIVACR